MARKPQQDRAKEKARKQKIILACLAIVLVLLLVIQGPKTLKLLRNKPAAPVVAAAATTTSTATSAAPAVVPTVAPVTVTPSELVSAVQPSVDAGQLREFSHFASKDPFAAQAPTPSSSSSTTPASTTPASTTPKAPPAPPSPPPTSAVISLNGELQSVTVNTDFPTAGTVFSRFGSLFHLESLTKTTAKVTIVGGSYADGAPALTLTLGKPVTLQNTADGTRYTLVLEPQGTPLPVSTTSTPTSTTPGSVVPTGP
ncbi:MAG TPA: hypothetical protein VFM96_03920 [Gaiellaceae bacterium]|nr:hypothetical protein [Gaiellaceae bacterium]